MSKQLTTLALGEEDSTTSIRGEEDPIFTTLAVGEEDPTTAARGEEEVVTTHAVGEEDGSLSPVVGDPFGGF